MAVSESCLLLALQKHWCTIVDHVGNLIAALYRSGPRLARAYIRASEIDGAIAAPVGVLTSPGAASSS
jgi:hypothetical protein